MASVAMAVLTLAGALASWGALGWLLTNVPPSTPLAVPAAYVFAFTAMTTSGALLAWLVLGRRRDRGHGRSTAGYLAHAMLPSLLVLFAMWLQSLRTLSTVVVVLLIGLYAFLELAILFGTRGSVELPVRQ